MNRRNFIAKSSMALFATTALPTPKFKLNSTPYTYKTKVEQGKWYYELIIFHESIVTFDKATDEEKVITLKVAFFETSDFSKPSQQGEYKYKIRKVEKDKNEAEYNIIETKFVSKVSGDHKFPKNFPKNMKLRGKTYTSFDILDKKDVSLVNIPYPVSTSAGGESCFLTTACVQEKKLADNCVELTTLRFLRDNYMSSKPTGKNLIKEYNTIGPQLVNAINNCENKSEIYDFMYHNMILPAVELVKDKKYKQATNFYKKSVQELFSTFIKSNN